ncbi:MAG: Rpn family recombination-promoting nuclease/putative transposase [Butyrivibrio sp.]|nr:Rpn family recombination-promoting nuclease/putative transposase [Butyrivibrio sp.]MBR1643007.1 Rpn family recombination-promoting nuclease/putative transposase [Butyrivibrio sp.]
MKKGEKISDSQKGSIINRQVADNGGKLIFENPLLCSQLLNNYVVMDGLSKIRPEDIEDVTERFIPMFTEQRDADVVKKIHLQDNHEIFVALIEHKSGVDYNVVMQILRYMVYIWEDFEKQSDQEKPFVSRSKEFKYPPILPIVYYEGKRPWTADRALSNRIVLNEVFENYIPNFRYYLICLNEHSKEELIEKKDELSFVMLINKIKGAKEFKNFKLPDDYLDNMLRKSPEDVLDVIARVVAVVLRKQNVPEGDVQNMMDKIKRRQPMGLFDEWEGFDVQKVDRIGQDKGKTKKLIEIVSKKIALGQDSEQIARDLIEDERYIQSIYDVAIKYAPEYDSEEIYAELERINQLVKS